MKDSELRKCTDRNWRCCSQSLWGGTAVLVNYVQAFRANAVALEAAWGGVTEDIRPIYFVVQLLAMLGYFAYAYFILFRLNPDEARIADRFGDGPFNVIRLNTNDKNSQA
jgi:hypothetical protein